MDAEIVNITEIQNLLFDYAEGKYNNRLTISDARDERDIIVSGINMLGEELEHSTISKDYFRSIYNAISDFVIVTDVNGIVLDINNAFVILLGSQKEHFIGKEVTSLLSNSEKHVLKTIQEIFRQGKQHTSFESFFKTTEKHIPISCTVSKITGKFEIHKGYLIIAKDISTEKKLESELINAIISTEEKERRRIAYDLHDALGQELNSVKMFFDTLISMDKTNPQFHVILDTCRSLVNDSIDTVRDLSYDIMPKSLEDEKLFSAFLEITNKNTGVAEFNLEVPNYEFSLSKETKIAIFRISQEFIANSLKHGKASLISIKANKANTYYSFSMSDNGKGYNPRKVQLGRGIRNITSRLKSINAQYSLQSSLKKGTTLNFFIK